MADTELSEAFSRSELIWGKKAQEELARKKVYIFGIGGVGSFAAEAIVRAGVGSVVFTDADRVAPSNLNRQLFALSSTVGMFKTDVCVMRAKDINPAGKFEGRSVFYDESTAKDFDFSDADFILDCIDSLGSKLLLIKNAKAAGKRIICSMGAGNKLDPSLFRIDDIEKTQVCPLAKAVRTALRKEGIKDVPVVYSTEPVKRAEPSSGARTIGSVSFVPSCAGLMMAGYAVRSMISDVTEK